MSSKTKQLIYSTLTVDLGTAHTNTEYPLPGIFDNLTVINLTGSASIRLNEKTRDSLDLALLPVINAAAIDRIFLTNTAQTGATLVLGLGADSSFSLQPLILPRMLNPVTGLYEVLKTPTVFKTADTINTAGSNTVWTPAGGKKYRLLGFVITLSKDAAAAGAELLKLNDQGGTTIWNQELSSGALVATGNYWTIQVTLPGNGFLSPTADNVLSLWLQAALTAGYCSFVGWGTEE